MFNLELSLFLPEWLTIGKLRHWQYPPALPKHNGAKRRFNHLRFMTFFFGKKPAKKCLQVFETDDVQKSNTGLQKTK